MLQKKKKHFRKKLVFWRKLRVIWKVLIFFLGTQKVANMGGKSNFKSALNKIPKRNK